MVREHFEDPFVQKIPGMKKLSDYYLFFEGYMGTKIGLHRQDH